MATSQMKKPETKTGTVSTLILWVLSSDSSYQCVIFIHKYVEVGGSPILECSYMASSTHGGEHTTQYILQGIGVGEIEKRINTDRTKPAPPNSRVGTIRIFSFHSEISYANILIFCFNM